MDIRAFLTNGAKRAWHGDQSKPLKRGKVEGDTAVKSSCASLPAMNQKTDTVLYRDLCEIFQKIESISSRLEIQKTLRSFFHDLLSKKSKDLEACVFLACNQVAPDYMGIELGIGDGLLVKAISQITGKSMESVKSSYTKEGDLGIVASRFKSTQRTLSFAAKKSDLHVQAVLEIFKNLANTSGSKSQDRKVDQIKGLLIAASPLEIRFLIRGLQGKLRIGLAKQTVLIALAQASVILSEEQGKSSVDGSTLHPLAQELFESSTLEEKFAAGASIVKQAFSVCPSLSELVSGLLDGSIYHLLEHCKLMPGIPVSPMLAKPEKSVAKVMSRINGTEVVLEYKYDGERCQIHCLESGEMKFFSRNLEDVTSKYPDLVSVMKEAAKEQLTSYIIDAEVVAIDRKRNQLLPFQVLSTRKRKDETAENVKVQVVIQAFDLLFLNGRSMVEESLRTRREHLKESFAEKPGLFMFTAAVEYIENGDSSPVEEFMQEAVRFNCEGLMVKTLEKSATYEPSKRSLNWLKLKKDYLNDGSSIADSLDLVPIGAYFGRGKRVGTFGAYLLACYDPDAEEYQSVCKIGTGFSNEQLQALNDALKEHAAAQKPSYFCVSDSCVPDVWINPRKMEERRVQQLGSRCVSLSTYRRGHPSVTSMPFPAMNLSYRVAQVWEVRAADLSISPVHKAAVGRADPTRGISIRFPRLIREREDKSPENATTSGEIFEMYRSQDGVKNSSNSGRGDGVGREGEEDEDDWEI